MFTVRELKPFVHQMDAERFEQQMGPFALMQRPRLDSRVDEELDREGSTDSTRIQPALRIRPMPSTVDFADLIVATLPPPSSDGSMRLEIGRAPDCDLVLHDTLVSKHHARVAWDGENAVLEELGSANGTFVNGFKMKQRWTLRDGDQLTFGESHFVFLSTRRLHLKLLRLP